MAKPKPSLDDAARDAQLEMLRHMVRMLAAQLDAVAHLLPASADGLKASIARQAAAARAVVKGEPSC